MIISLDKALWVAFWVTLLWPLVSNYRMIPYAAVAASQAILWPSNGDMIKWLMKTLFGS